jgi:AhpD family alkylhydroperoxidase
MVEYEDATDEVRAVFDDIMESRGIDFVPNFWRTIAHHPPTLKSVWSHLKAVMAPGTIDALTKEMIAIAVSATNGCEYCINSHIAGARKLGMSDAQFGELMAVVGMFNQTNKLVEGYQVPGRRAHPPFRPGRGREGTAAARAGAKAGCCKEARSSAAGAEHANPQGAAVD